MSKTFDSPKDPDDIRDFGVDWTLDIGDNTITSSTWTVVSGDVVIETHSWSDTSTTVRLSGGSVGKQSLLNRVVLSDDEQFDQTCILTVKER